MSKQLSHSIYSTLCSTIMVVLALFNSILSVSWKHNDSGVVHLVSISFAISSDSSRLIWHIVKHPR